MQLIISSLAFGAGAVICLRGAYNSMAVKATPAQANMGLVLGLCAVILLVFLGASLGLVLELANA
jgi:hypothetical protein